MAKITEFTFGGRACKVAPPPFSEEACELVDLFEESGAIAKANEGLEEADKKPFCKNGRMLILLRRVAMNCLMRGGHTSDEANDILLSVTMDENEDDGIPALAEALGLV